MSEAQKSWWEFMYDLRFTLEPTDAEVVSQPFDLRMTKKEAEGIIRTMRYMNGGRK